MQLTGKEISLMVYVMKFTPEITTGMTNTGVSIETPKLRQFQDEEFTLALPLFTKFKKSIAEDKYIDGEVELDTEEKAFLLKLITRPWTLEEAEVQVPLKDKLKK